MDKIISFDEFIEHNKEKSQIGINIKKFDHSLTKIKGKYFISSKIIENICDSVKIPEHYEITCYDRECYDQINILITKKKDYRDFRLNKTIYTSLDEIINSIQQPIYRFGYDGFSSTYYGSILFYDMLSQLLNNAENNAIMRLNKFTNIENNLYKQRTDEIYHDIVIEANYDRLCLHKHNNKLSNNIIVDNNYEKINTFGLTPIECAIQMYKNCSNNIIKANLMNIIVSLSEPNYIYRRHPLIFASYLFVGDDNLKELYDILSKIKCKYDIIYDFSRKKKPSISSLTELINVSMFDYLIKNNLFDIIDYIEYIWHNSYVLNYLSLIKNKDNYTDKIKEILVKIYDKHKSDMDINIFISVILDFQFLDLFEQLKINDRIDGKYIETIFCNLVEGKKYMSILYMLKFYEINKLLDQFEKPLYRSVIEMIDSGESFIKMVKLLSKYDVNLFVSHNKHDKYNNTILHEIALVKPNLFLFIMKHILSFGFNVWEENNDGNTFLHILCERNRNSHNNQTLDYKYNNTNIINYILNEIKLCTNYRIEDGINKQNKNGYTPLLISVMTEQEDLYKLLKKYDANDLITDHHGNTVYHYICRNELLIGSKIISTMNKYGYKPIDLTRLKSHYIY